MSFRRLFAHPFMLALALLATLMIVAGLDRMAGTEGAYSMLERVGVSLGQQVVVVGHRVVQQVEVIGHQLRGRN